jgi:hypothetical protein
LILPRISHKDSNISWFPILLPRIEGLTKFLKEEYAKLWFDLAKISITSLVVKLFEPGGPEITWVNIIVFMDGLIIFLLCVRVGLYIGREEKI